MSTENKKIWNVWLDAEEKIASFHWVKDYKLQTFPEHDDFFKYLQSLQEEGFRFQ